jgi:hypothetical protein
MPKIIKCHDFCFFKSRFPFADMVETDCVEVQFYGRGREKVKQ